MWKNIWSILAKSSQKSTIKSEEIQTQSEPIIQQEINYKSTTNIMSGQEEIDTTNSSTITEILIKPDTIKKPTNSESNSETITETLINLQTKPPTTVESSDFILKSDDMTDNLPSISLTPSHDSKPISILSSSSNSSKFGRSTGSIHYGKDRGGGRYQLRSQRKKCYKEEKWSKEVSERIEEHKEYINST